MVETGRRKFIVREVKQEEKKSTMLMAQGWYMKHVNYKIWSVLLFSNNIMKRKDLFKSFDKYSSCDTV